jgi:hypothetical protein
LKFKFPNPDSNFKLADIDKALTDAIIRKFNFFHLIIYSCLSHSLFKTIESI